MGGYWQAARGEAVAGGGELPRRGVRGGLDLELATEAREVFTVREGCPNF